MLSKDSLLFRAGLETCHLSGAHRYAAPLLAGCGAILSLYHVRPRSRETFQPNRALEITPEFLEQTILYLRRQGFDIVSLEEACRRLCRQDAQSKYVALTFEHGYRDLLAYAHPILKKHDCPFTLFVPTAYPDGRGVLWWRAVEEVIRKRDVITIQAGGELRIYLSASLEEKQEAFDEICWWLKTLDHEKLRIFMQDFCASFKFDFQAEAATACMDWAELAELAKDPLVTIGAATVDHANLCQVGGQELTRQIIEGARIMEAALGRQPKYLSYPYGGADAAGAREFTIARELGFEAAVTTRAGILFEEHKDFLHALPRLPLSGNYQAVRYLDVLLSGLPHYVANGFARCSA